MIPSSLGLALFAMGVGLGVLLNHMYRMSRLERIKESFVDEIVRSAERKRSAQGVQ